MSTRHDSLRDTGPSKRIAKKEYPYVHPLYREPSASVEDRVEHLLSLEFHP
jgi:hypothetical protein